MLDPNRVMNHDPVNFQKRIKKSQKKRSGQDTRKVECFYTPEKQKEKNKGVKTQAVSENLRFHQILKEEILEQAPDSKKNRSPYLPHGRK